MNYILETTYYGLQLAHGSCLQRNYHHYFSSWNSQEDSRACCYTLHKYCQPRKPSEKENPPLGCVESLARVTSLETGWAEMRKADLQTSKNSDHWFPFCLQVHSGKFQREARMWSAQPPRLQAQPSWTSQNINSDGMMQGSNTNNSGHVT